LARRGFFIPSRHADAAPPAGARPPYPAAEARLADCEARFREALGWLDAYGEDLLRIGSDPAPAPRWGQGWFPRLDGAMAYALVRRLAPRRIVEVGCGHSTRFLARAVRDGALDTTITAIDPTPRAAIAELPVTLLRHAVQDCVAGGTGSEVFGALSAGDFLMIDSSHVLMPGSDVDLLLGRVVPALPSGAVLHLHDIFLPDDYPAAWDWRGYNEQLGVLPLLLDGAWEVLFASHYVVTRMAAALEGSVAARLPLAPEAIESSLWLRKR
jgi:predicted O-methyltransferase YrrM